MQNFHNFMEKHSFRDEDMLMRFFVRSFDAKARDWYLSFPKRSFACWDELVDYFRKEFARETADLIARLMEIRRQYEEPSIDFSHRFAVALSQIPEDFRPDAPTCIGIYFEAFEKGSSALLREFKITDVQMEYKFLENTEKMKSEHI